MICYVNAFSQQSFISQGKKISLGNGEFKITKVRHSDETPSQKIKASADNHYMLISLELIAIKKDAEFSSLCFFITDEANRMYSKPGAWGEIEAMGGKSKFEASKGATVYIRNKGETLNLIFETPKTVQANHVKLQYDEKCAESLKAEDENIEKPTSDKFTIESIKLFEFGTERPLKADRFYAETFDKDYTRYIGVEVNFINHLYKKEYQEHPIEFIWYNAQGVVEGKQQGTVQINKDWRSSYYNTNGWGWKKAGNWLVGDYKVEIKINGVNVGEKKFSIREKGYDVQSIKIFGYKNIEPKIKDRTYPETLNTDSIKSLGVEISFNNRLFKKAAQEHDLTLKWYGADGKYQGKQKGRIKIKKEWSSSYYTSSGWGFKELGKWKPGNYRAEVFIDNNFVGEKTIEIIKFEPVKYSVKPIGNLRIIQVSFVGMSSGFQNTFTAIFDKENSGVLCPRDKKMIVLESESKEINPGRALMNNGDFVVDVGKGMKTFGSTQYAMVKSSDTTGFKMFGFKRKGTDEKLIGISVAEPSSVYAKTPDNKTEKIAKIKWENVTSSDGVTQRAQVIKLNRARAKWTVGLGKKILEINGKKRKQIGWMTWRVITLPDNTKQTILMTKTMARRAKWIGRFDGKLYATK